MKIVQSTVRLIARCVFYLLVLPGLLILEPFKKFRFGTLHDGRYGHLTLNTEVFLRQLQLRRLPYHGETFIFFSHAPANTAVVDMYKRVLKVITGYLPKKFYALIEPDLQKTRFHEPLKFIGTEHFEFTHGKPALAFNAEEEGNGRSFLREVGLSEDDWFVCFHSRDPAYFAERQGFGETFLKESIRDCSIETYYPAMKWVAQQGGWAFRMGAIIDKPLPDLGDRVIDYAQHYRSDFLDNYISAKCRFFFGCASGAHSAAYLFNKPVAGAHWAPFWETTLGRRSLIAPKQLRDLNTGQVLSFPEVWALGIHEKWPTQTVSYYREHLGLEWVANTPEDVLDLCKDMADLSDGTVPDPETVAIQNAYQWLFRSVPPPDDESLFNKTYHRYDIGTHRHPDAGRINPRYARKYQHLILPE